MKKSRYNMEVRRGSYWLIYNLFAATCVILDESEYQDYICLSNPQQAQELEHLGIYVDDWYDEIEGVQYAIRRNSDYRNQNIRKHRIFTTLACNAKCPYCFERQILGSTSMTQETADCVADSIIKQQGFAKELAITWFGGEPLLNIGVIDRISATLQSHFGENVQFSSFMITNGLLFDKELAERSTEDWKLQGVQITLDGLKETYESTKRFSVNDSFDRVLSNIDMLLDAGIRVTIRLNYSLKTFGEILELIDYLGRRFDGRNGLFVYAYKVFEETNLDNSKAGSYEYDIQITERILKAGLIEDLLETIKPHMISCTAGSLYNLMYLPDGRIGKCAQAISNGDTIGDIETGLNQKQASKWGCGHISDKCLQCKLLPICGGGCIYEINKGRNGCSHSIELVEYKLKHYLAECLTKYRLS